jgi:hypothetical protein
MQIQRTYSEGNRIKIKPVAPILMETVGKKKPTAPYVLQTAVICGLIAIARRYLCLFLLADRLNL